MVVVLVVSVGEGGLWGAAAECSKEGACSSREERWVDSADTSSRESIHLVAMRLVVVVRLDISYITCVCMYISTYFVERNVCMFCVSALIEEISACAFTVHCAKL